MRQPKFKGKDKEGNWHFGDVLHHDHGVVVIVDDAGKQHKIIPETRSEFTGLNDCEGNAIYENDILKFKLWNGTYVTDYVVKLLPFIRLSDDINFRTCYLIGNVFDNNE